MLALLLHLHLHLHHLHPLLPAPLVLQEQGLRGLELAVDEAARHIAQIGRQRAESAVVRRRRRRRRHGSRSARGRE